METQKLSAQQSVWEMDASSAWSWIVSSIRNRWRRSRTRVRSLRGAMRSEPSPSKSSKRPLGTDVWNAEVLKRHQRLNLPEAIAAQRRLMTPPSGSAETSEPQELIWSMQQQCYVRRNQHTRNGQLLQRPWR